MPEESVGFLFDLFRFFKLTMMVVKKRKVTVSRLGDCCSCTSCYSLRGRGALEISKILFLESVERREKALAFLLLFLLVTRVKAISSVSGTSTAILTSGNCVGMELGP